MTKLAIPARLHAKPALEADKQTLQNAGRGIGMEEAGDNVGFMAEKLA